MIGEVVLAAIAFAGAIHKPSPSSKTSMNPRQRPSDNARGDFIRQSPAPVSQDYLLRAELKRAGTETDANKNGAPPTRCPTYQQLELLIVVEIQRSGAELLALYHWTRHLGRYRCWHGCGGSVTL